MFCPAHRAERRTELGAKVGGSQIAGVLRNGWCQEEYLACGKGNGGNAAEGCGTAVIKRFADAKPICVACSGVNSSTRNGCSMSVLSTQSEHEDRPKMPERRQECVFKDRQKQPEYESLC